MFSYDVLAWENLKREYLASTEDVEFFSFEVSRDPNRPFLAALKNKADGDNWDELRMRWNHKYVEVLEERIALDVKSKIGALQYLNRTLGFARTAQVKLEKIIPEILDHVSTVSFLEDLEPVDRLKLLKVLSEFWFKINKVERESLGVNDPEQIIKELMSNFGQGKSLEEVYQQVQAMNEHELTSLLTDIVNG